MLAKEFVRAPVHFHEFDVAAIFGGCGFDGGDGDGGDFLADAVAGDDGDPGFQPAIAQRGMRHRSGSADGNEYEVRYHSRR